MAKKKNKPEIPEGEEFVLEKITEDEVNKTKEYAVLDLSPEMKKDIVDLIKGEIDGLEEGDDPDRKDMEDHIEYCRRRNLMLEYDTNDPFPNCSKMRTGTTRSTLKRLDARIYKALWKSGDIVHRKPNKMVSDDIAQKQQKYIDSKIRRELKLHQNMRRTQWDAECLNFGLFKLFRTFEEKEAGETVTVYETWQELLRNYSIKDLTANKKYQGYIKHLTGLEAEEFVKMINQRAEGQPVEIPNTGKPLRLREKRYDVELMNQGEYINFNDFFVNSGFNGDLNDPNTWLIAHRLYMRRSEISRRKENDFFDEFDEEALFGNIDKIIKDYGKQYEIFETILTFDYDGTGEERKGVIWLARNDKGDWQYLRGIEYPYEHNRSYIILFRVEAPHYGPYHGGGGLGYALKEDNRLEDKVVNQMVNAWDIMVNPPIAHEQPINGGAFDPASDEMYLGAIIPQAQGEKLTPLQLMPGIPPSGHALMQYVHQRLEVMAGQPEQLYSGQVTPQDPTGPAKKTMALLGEASINIADYIEVYLEGFEELINQFQHNCHQFTDMTELRYQTETGYENISKADLSAEVNTSFEHIIHAATKEDRAKAAFAWKAALADNVFYNQNLSAQLYIFKFITNNWDPQFAREIDEMLPEGMLAMVKRQKEQAARAQLAEQQGKELERQGYSKDAVRMAEDMIMRGEQPDMEKIKKIASYRKGIKKGQEDKYEEAGKLMATEGPE